MAKQTTVISHWYKLIENFQTSSIDFYQSVETAIKDRSVPEFHSARIEHKEGGLAGANREYIRIHRGKYAFDICAAPFGNGFFVSWWFTEPPLAFALLYTIGFIIGFLIASDLAYTIGYYMGTATFGIVGGVLIGWAFSGLGVPILLFILGSKVRNGSIAGESRILAMPLIGWIYERIFTPQTYYSIDTGLMFQEAVHNSVLEVIDCVTANKGVRALTEVDRKPILKKFAAAL